MTVTNTSTVAKTVSLSGTLTWTFPNGIAEKNVVYGWLLRSSNSRLGDTSFPDFEHVVAAGDASSFDWKPVKQDAIAAGATVTYWLVAKESFFSPPVRYFNESLHAELAP